MPRRAQSRVVEMTVRCYPPSWRDRHGDEATELAQLLMRDGMSAALVVCSYLRGAVREQLVARQRGRLGRTVRSLVVAAAVIVVPLVLLDPSTAANASGTEVIAVISSRGHAVAQLESVFRSHHFNIQVEVEPAAPSRVGSILAVSADHETGELAALREIPGPCVGGISGCIDAIAVPLHFTGHARVVVGRRAEPGETYFRSPSTLGPR